MNQKPIRPATQAGKNGQQEQEKKLIAEEAKEYRKRIADNTLPFIQEVILANRQTSADSVSGSHRHEL